MIKIKENDISKYVSTITVIHISIQICMSAVYTNTTYLLYLQEYIVVSTICIILVVFYNTKEINGKSL